MTESGLRKPRWDGTISLGNVLSIATVLCAGAVGAATFGAKVGTLERDQARLEVRMTAAELAAVALRADLNDLQRTTAVDIATIRQDIGYIRSAIDRTLAGGT